MLYDTIIINSDVIDWECAAVYHAWERRETFLGNPIEKIQLGMQNSKNNFKMYGVLNKQGCVSEEDKLAVYVRLLAGTHKVVNFCIRKI